MLGPATELVYETAAPFLWSWSPAPDGSLFVGTGNEGKVFEIDPQGKGSLFFDAPSSRCTRWRRRPNGGLYVGTSPDGKIYKVDRNGNGDDVLRSATTSTSGRWRSTRTATLFAGTGEKGVIYRITPDGKGAPFYKTNATHVTALAFDKAGNLLVGTGSPGRVLRIDPDGKAFVLLDSPFQEIHALRVRRQGHALRRRAQRPPGCGAAPVATDSGRRSRRPAASVDARAGRRRCRPRSPRCRSSTSAASRRRRRRRARIAARRRAPSTASRPTACGISSGSRATTRRTTSRSTQNGALVVGTGNKGKIYRLEGDPLRPTLLARARGAAGHRVLQGRARPAVLRDRESRQAVPRSRPSARRAARTSPRPATRRWSRPGARSAGAAPSPAGSQIELFTRSGNTETPDDTWSAWSAAYTNADGSPITSPKARYLQWRAVLTGKGDGPVLTSVTAAYLQRNLRPQVRSITVHPPGIVFQKPFTTGEPELAGFDDQTTPDRKLAAAAQTRAGAGSSPSLGRRTYQKGLQTLVWKADDENDDDLMYDVLYRREGETAWKTLRKASDRADSRLGHDDRAERHLLREGRRVRRAVESRRHRAHRRARQRGVRDRQHAAGDRRSRGVARRARPHDRHRSTSRTITRRFSASSSRRTASAGAACSRSTASPTRRRSTTSWRSTARSASAG